MEPHRTRPPQRQQAPVAPPRPRGGAVVRAAGLPTPSGAHPAPARGLAPLVRALRRFPGPRLTGLGAGLFATAVMVLVGFLDDLLLDDAPVVYGALFLPVSALTALWVRGGDLVTAPIAVPIAFTAGAVPLAGAYTGGGGIAMGVVTALAVHAAWLYAGTLVAGLVAAARRAGQLSRRLPERRVPAMRHPGARRG